MDIEQSHSIKVPFNIIQQFLSEQNKTLLNTLNHDTPKTQNESLINNYTFDPQNIISLNENQSGNYNQYSYLYNARYNQCLQSLQDKAKEKWPDVSLCKNIIDLKGFEPKAIIGITYKEMPCKPSILKNIEAMIGSRKVKSFVSESQDYLCLEDPSGRIRINSELSKDVINIGNFITGIPITLKGVLDDKGLFIVKDYTFMNSTIHHKILRSNITTTVTPSLTSSMRDYIMFISDLEIGSVSDNDNRNALARNMLLNFIQNTGNVSQIISEYANQIQRVIICGNSIYSPPDTELVEKGSFRKQNLNNTVYKQILSNYEQLDDFINKLTHYIPVDIIPSLDDLSSDYFPTPAISEIMFPQSSSCLNKTFNLVTNPYSFQLDGISFLGTSGDNINTIKQYSTLTNALEIMKLTLEWGHLAPCAPDGIRTYPYKQVDNLVKFNIPDVYFCGSQQEGAIKQEVLKDKEVNIITVPKFSSTGSVVIYNIKTKEMKLLKFGYV